jgi:tetratricopeptide (TPR) repeat protein
MIVARHTASPIALAFFLAAGCASAPSEPVISAQDRAKAVNDNIRISLGGNALGAPMSGTRSSAAQAEETAARRAAQRRAALAARKEQDETYAKRADDASFVNIYKTDDRNDSMKMYLYGRALGKVQQLAEAAAQFEAAAAADARNPWPHEGLGVCHFLQKQYDRAIARLKKSTEIDPEIAEGYFGLARALQAAGRIDEAVSAAESCVRCDEDAARGPLLLAEIRTQKNQVDKAIAALKPAVEKSPDDITLRLALADAYGKNGNTLEAAQQLDAALTKGQLPPDRLLTVAGLYRRAERFAKAQEILEKLVKEAPDEFWKARSREDIEKLVETVKQEKALGHRIEYTVDELLRMFKSHPDAERRRFAADMLRQFPFPEIDQAYVGALQDAAGDIRVIAVTEVAKRAKEMAVKALAVMSRGDRDERVRAAACSALGDIDVKESHEALLIALQDPIGHVRAASNRALEKLTGRILIPGGVESIDDAGRRDAQERWKAVLLERKPKTSEAPTDQIPPPPAR